MAEKFKNNLKELCKKIANDDEPVESLFEFFEENREEFFGNSNPLEKTREMMEQPLTNFTCSCGSREDSCSEDGQGKYSRFYITEHGNIFREIKNK